MKNKLTYCVMALVLLLSSKYLQSQNQTLEIAELIAENPREVESKKEFKVRGILSRSVNLGLLNTYQLKDREQPDKYIHVISQYDTQPGKVGDVLELNLTFYKELSIGAKRLLIFKEVKNSS